MPSDFHTLESFSPKLFEPLAGSIRGPLYTRADPKSVHASQTTDDQSTNPPLVVASRFTEHVQIFNGNVRSPAQAIAFPLDAEDVSRCVPRSLSHHSRVSLVLDVAQRAHGIRGTLWRPLVRHLYTPFNTSHSQGPLHCFPLKITLKLTLTFSMTFQDRDIQQLQFLVPVSQGRWLWNRRMVSQWRHHR
jgi:hypothetical protein